MAYQLSLVIECQSYPSRKTAVILFSLRFAWNGRSYFPKGLGPNVNQKERLEFELVYFEVKYQHVSHYTNDISPHFILHQNDTILDGKSTLLLVENSIQNSIIPTYREISTNTSQCTNNIFASLNKKSDSKFKVFPDPSHIVTDCFKRNWTYVQIDYQWKKSLDKQTLALV